MDKYRKLISNTVIFAIGTFSSKVLVFFLMPLYTSVLDPESYGVVDLIVQTGNLLIPIVSIGVINAVVRFGLDDAVRKSDVFSTGIFTILGGFALLVACYPLLDMIPSIAGHTVLVYVFVLMSCTRSLCSQFVRAKGYVRLYAFDGVLSTIATILFNVLYLVVFRWGINGYIMAIFSADLLSSIFLFFTAKLYRYIRFRGIRRDTSTAMLRYCIPLIPNTVFWWIMNAADRYIVTEMMGAQANGLLAVAYKVPTIVNLVSTIFMDAWQISAVTEKGTLARERFFTKVFRTYQSLLFSAASGLILISKLLTRLLTSNPSYYPSWQFIPLLVMATVFSCMGTFLGTVYIAEKKSVFTLVTTAVGAILNVGLNLLLIPQYGVNGATFATLVGYLCVFVLRAIDTRRYIRIRMNVTKMIFNTAVLGAQCAVMILELPYWIAWEIGLTLLMIVTNLGGIVMTLQKLLAKRLGGKGRTDDN
ncbi:polysaccharide biosynthesis C-terminal domain-containing protein [Clostridiaceae bacterium NSJ-31]|uniref:Polysaccharide biosynthesis C-terminal domain-containing protein n=3 Tax=Ligaoa zhengdingensis TaxID=2763658 RepID=A0A926DWM8_9FIRM|nr:polysaccharide biosynthesis C-terminal domain-containing protein [Ligaoa zhengdingensis]